MAPLLAEIAYIWAWELELEDEVKFTDMSALHLAVSFEMEAALRVMLPTAGPAIEFEACG